GGDCKATTTSTSPATRLTPPTTAGTHDHIGEATHMDIAADGRIFYIGRASCFVGDARPDDWDIPGAGLGCGTIHVWDPSIPGSDDQNAAKISLAGELQVFGNRGGGSEVGPNGKTETGLVG